MWGYSFEGGVVLLWQGNAHSLLNNIALLLGDVLGTKLVKVIIFINSSLLGALKWMCLSSNSSQRVCVYNMREFCWGTGNFFLPWGLTFDL